MIVVPPHPAMLDDEALLAQCDVRRGRTSGRGGQHRNKVETAVTLTHTPTGVKGAAGERRSQHANHDVATFRLRVRLAVEVRTRANPASPPSERWRARLQGRRIAVNPAHHDFPALLAEALDRAAAANWDLPQAAEALGCSTSQLVKLFKVEPAAMELVNARRTEQGERTYR